MDIRIVDRRRNFTQVPTKGPPFSETTTGEGKDKRVTTYADILNGLLASVAGRADTGSVEFECDREFLDALSKENPEGLVGQEKGIKTANGYILRTYKGVHVVVTGPQVHEPV